MLFIQHGGTLDWSKVYSFAHRQRQACTTSVSVCPSYYIHSGAPGHQLWRAFTWVDRWLSWGSAAPNRGALTCQLSVSLPKPALSCHLFHANHSDTSSLCQETVLDIGQSNTTLPWANRRTRQLLWSRDDNVNVGRAHANNYN